MSCKAWVFNKNPVIPTERSEWRDLGTIILRRPLGYARGDKYGGNRFINPVLRVEYIINMLNLYFIQGGNQYVFRT